ncbi:hypothetical protein [Thermosulfurimonas sp. F29]|uniref:hypothetical protein n=1 Tax=Thermosulfurimonas sp. F29 TaxID=2867247 RepID=UPI001C83E23A|nr:hypothetical protein [Thermosulfurimonas sp. F29]MBX6423525.1 hypothetical protein [Thermosulfurimonas sp. F29]
MDVKKWAIMLCAISVALSSGICSAGQTEGFRTGKTVKGKGPVRIPPPARIPVDLSIFVAGNKNYVSGCTPCQSELGKVDAIFLNDITVGIRCSARNVRSATGTLTVSYYSISAHRIVTQSKTFTVPCKGQPREVLVTVVNHPLLIGARMGIWAKITPQRPFVDTNPNNNQKVETDPGKMCVMSGVY